MKFYKNFFLKGSTLFVREHDNGQDFEREFEVKPNLYLESSDGNHSDIFGNTLKEISFDSPQDARKFAGSVTNKIVCGFDRFAYTEINSMYGNEYDATKIKIIAIDIENNIDDIKGFPDVENANCPINAITLSFRGTLFTFTTIDTTNDEPDVRFTKCRTEKEMLLRFMQIYCMIKADIITGWNCIPVDQSLWLDDKIIRIGDVGKTRVLYDSLVDYVYPITKKEKFNIILSNGKCIGSSEDHIFPVRIKPNDIYTDDLLSYPIHDVKLKDIPKLMIDNNVYIESAIRENKNIDLTYRNFFINNIEEIYNAGVDVRIRTPRITRLMSAHLGVCVGDGECSRTEYYYSRLSKYLPQEEIKAALSTMDEIVYRSERAKRISTIDNLDAPISDDDCWLMGMWYTDGTQSYKTEVGFTNKNIGIIDNIARILGKQGHISKKDGCTYFKVGLTTKNRLIMKIFLYKNAMDSKKSLNVRFLSQMSKHQYLTFVSGLVDGDGSIYTNGDNSSYSICNYNGDAHNMAELLEWNGVNASYRKNNTHFSVALPHVYHTEKKNFSVCSSYGTKSKNKNISKMNFDGGVFHRIDEIVSTGETVDMIDIQTNTHYFRTMGVKTHNCNGYDIPFLIKRIEIVCGKDVMKKLSPFGIVKTKKVIDETGRSSFENEIAGVSLLDYLEIYKKFRLITRESYKLDFIAKIELNDSKVEYDCSFREFYALHPHEFIRYNAHDVRLIDKLEKKLSMIQLVIDIAYVAKCNYIDVMKNSRVWDIIIANYLADKGVQVPFKKSGDGSGETYEGAFVQDPIRGYYDWIISEDATALYPSMIIQYNISPETIMPKETWATIRPMDIVNKTDAYHQAKSVADKYSATLCGNGVMFKTDQVGFVPTLAEMMFDKRKEAKDIMLDWQKKLEKINKELETRVQ